MGGDTSTKGKVQTEAFATDVPYIVFGDAAKSEACNKPLGSKKSFVLANPNRGNEVGIKPI